MNLLLLSNSRSPDRGYLEHALAPIAEILGGKRRGLFLPFAGVTTTWDDYTAKVREALAPLDLDLVGAHTVSDPVAVVADVEFVMVGGGNTFRLLAEARQRGWLPVLDAAVRGGLPYVGWSAGSNLACPGLYTTNDMPIVDPQGFEALGLVPFQINPHYTDAAIPGHGGESRAQRIAEYLALRPEEIVLGLPEGAWLRVNGEGMTLEGPHPATLFRGGAEPAAVPPGPFAA